MCARSGANCGSLFLDLRFRELVRTLLADHPAHLDAASLAYFMHSFSETEKINYRGEEQDSAMFNFTCFNVEDPDDAQVGLFNGELSIPGNLLRREVFDPVVNQVRYLFSTGVFARSFWPFTCIVYSSLAESCCDAGPGAHRRPNEESQPTR